MIYEALKNSDLTEGRGPMVRIACFTYRIDAEKAAKGWGVMGGGDGEVKEVQVYTTFKEFDEATMSDERRKALNKLSYREKQILGLL